MTFPERIRLHRSNLYNLPGNLPNQRLLQSWTSTTSQGATVVDSNYLEPANRLTRTYRETDGQLRLSVTSYNGLAVLYSTHGTT